LFSGGCPSQKKELGYYGPTDPILTVVDDINQNNQRIKTLWAKGDFSAWITGEKCRVGRVFDIGSNDTEYWLIVKPEIDMMWYGDYRRVAAPTTRPGAQIPIRPDLLLEILGIGEIDTDLVRQPVPVMRFNNDADAYMLVWNVKATSAPDRWVAQKEVWYDRATKRPKLVALFDENGRIVLRAYLSEHKPIAGAAKPAPQLASKYDLYFPQTDTKMQLTLGDIRAKNDKGFPTDASFAFPGTEAAAQTINLDEPPRR
jgi:hypothetical protein